MKFRKDLVLNLIIAVLLVVAIGLSPAVFADDDNNGSGASSEQEDEAEKHRNEQIEQRKNELLEQFNQRAKERLESARENAKQLKERSSENRKKSCEARKTSLERKMNRAVTQAEKHKGVFDKIYTRVKAFHDDKNLTTPNYAELVAKVDAAQFDAEAKIAALDSLDVDVDCSSETVAGAVSTFREALSDTREAMKTYRKALVDLIKTMHDSNDESNGSEQ